MHQSASNLADDPRLPLAVLLPLLLLLQPLLLLLQENLLLQLQTSLLLLRSTLLQGHLLQLLLQAGAASRA